MHFSRQLSFGLVALSALTLLCSTHVAHAQKPRDSKDSNPEFARAKKELSEDYYVLYRIIDKLSRANNNASSSWRVKLSDNYALNGFADEANLIIVPRPAVEQLSGNPDAIACMVGREMSHHIRKHQAIGPIEKASLKKQIQDEVVSQLKANENSKRGWGMGLGLVGSVLGVNTSGVQGMVNSGTDSASAKMIQEKESELNRRIAETSSRIDKEADEDAFIYLTRAGRDPKGCIKYLEFISRDPNAEADPSNPQIPGRIQAYREFIERESPDKFKKEGAANLSRLSRPLLFTSIDNGTALRINASGGTTKSQIDGF